MPNLPGKFCLKGFFSEIKLASRRKKKSLQEHTARYFIGKDSSKYGGIGQPPTSIFASRKYSPARVRKDFESHITLNDLENMDYQSGKHFVPKNISDSISLNLVKFFRTFADMYFQNRYIDRAVLVETVAAIPGLVGGLFRHLYSLRSLEDNGEAIQKLMREAVNERQHLLTFLELKKPGVLDRLLIRCGQAFFL